MDLFVCGLCNKAKSIERTLFLDCLHSYCKECILADILKKIRENRTSEVKCLECHALLPVHSLREVLDEKTFEKLSDAAVHEFLDSQRSNFTHCPNPTCKNVMELDTENESNRGARITCNTCGTVFCSSCRVTPYHSDYTCDQNQIFLAAQQCRFCKSPIGERKLDSFTNVCSSPECQAKRTMACNKILRCGHYCGGINRETSCLCCLHPNCNPAKAASYCGICWVDKLDAGPCIELQCGHIFHFECVRRQIHSLWNGSRISFRCTECALCKTKVNHPALSDELRTAMDLYLQVKEKAVERLRMIRKNETNERDNETANEAEIAMARFAYYLCDQCKLPYFGGENVCVEDNAADPKELICGKCSAKKNGESWCEKHGTEFLEYKCRFCCSPSIYFCWGTSHFCASCHARAAEVAVVPRDKLPPCTCNVPHPPNGEEFCYGCLCCKSEK